MFVEKECFFFFDNYRGRIRVNKEFGIYKVNIS